MIKLFLINQKILEFWEKGRLIQFIPFTFNALMITESNYSEMEDLISRCLMWKICLGWHFTWKLSNGLREVQKLLFERVYLIRSIGDPTVSVQVYGF